MDNLTHSLTAVLLTRAGLDRLTPRAMWIAVITANAPDFDAVTLASGLEAYFTEHRGFTHAIAFAPLVAALPVLMVAAIFRQRLPWLRAWLLSLTVVASHLLLDFTNTYGIRLLLPFSDAWPALDITYVVDVWIWAILLIASVWPMLSGLVSSEIGAKKGTGRGVAIVALLAVAMYDTGRYFLHRRAVEMMESRIYNGAAPQRVLALPRIGSPLSWDGWVQQGRAWMKMDVDLTREFDPEPVATYWQTDSQALVDSVKTIPIFQHLSGFARTPLWRVSPAEEPPGASKVELIDLRFGRGGRQGFTAEAIVDAQGQVVRSGFHF